MMPKIMPITVLEDSNAISDACQTAKEPIFLTKNGYGNMVIMSIETYETLVDVKKKLMEGETQRANGGAVDAETTLANLKSRFGL